MTTFVRRPQFDDVLAESRKTWNVELPSRGGAAMWEGWQPIGFNGPIPILNDPEHRERELSGAARDIKIQQTAAAENMSTTEVRQNQDAADGRPPPGGPATAQGGFQAPPVGAATSRYPAANLSGWWASRSIDRFVRPCKTVA